MAAILENRRTFIVLLGLAVLVKLGIAAWLPLTGDEAYFVFWGRHPDYGYYDHPPMVGWFLAALLAAGDATVWLRLPAVLIMLFIGWVVYLLLRGGDPVRARLAALLFWYTPVNLVGVLVTTDMPLILWSFLSALCFWRGQATGRGGWFLAAGLLLGLAFLSKFFAGLLGLAFAAWLAWHGGGWREGGRRLGLVLAGVLPAVALNLAWNYFHCWDNYLFNLLNRTRGAAFSPATLAGYGGLLLYLLTPPVIWYLYRHRGALAARLRDATGGVFLGLALVPALLFLVLSLVKNIGLHWLLSFYPFFVIGFAQAVPAAALRRSLAFMLPFGLLHAVLAGAALAVAPEGLKFLGESYKSVVIGTRMPQMLARMGAPADAVLASDSYALSAQMAYHAGREVPVFGRGSHHGRQDDIVTDFRRLDGRDFYILAENPTDHNFAWYFDQYTLHRLDVAGTHMYYGVGRGFRFERYRREVLADVMRRYYAIPAWLPHAPCYMHQRYGRLPER